jgi:LPXTG-motif cell wall-anchored protein
VYTLPATGLDAGALAGLALVAVVAGAALLRISRRLTA